MRSENVLRFAFYCCLLMALASAGRAQRRNIGEWDERRRNNS
jgi:hypothetical protein